MSSPGESSISVCLVEDDADIRQHLSFLLEHSHGLRLLNTYANAEQALGGIPEEKPDVVLMDINLPKLSGIECVRQLKARHPEIQFLMLTVYDDSNRVFEALAAGASGYLLKRSSLPDLIHAIHEVHHGGAPMTSVIARKVVQHFYRQREASSDLETLSPREEQVLAALARGSLYKEIAESLGISLDTVRRHIQHIYEKLHVHSRTEAVLKYVRS